MAASYGAAGRLAAAFIHSKLTPLFIVASTGARRAGDRGAAARRGTADHRPDGRRVRGDARRDAGRRGTARDAADGAAAVGGAGRRVRLLDLVARPVDGRRPLHGRRSRRGGARPTQSEARGQCRSHPARRHRTDRQAPLDRRRADPGGDRVVGALRRRSAAGAGRATARRHRRSHRRVRSDAHRRAAASAEGGRRSRRGSPPTGWIRWPFSARSPRPTRTAPRPGPSRADRSPASKPATGCGRPTRCAASSSALRAAVPCSCAIWPRWSTAMPSPPRMSPISRARPAPSRRSRSPSPSARAPTPSTSRIT